MESLSSFCPERNPRRYGVTLILAPSSKQAFAYLSDPRCSFGPVLDKGILCMAPKTRLADIPPSFRQSCRRFEEYDVGVLRTYGAPHLVFSDFSSALLVDIPPEKEFVECLDRLRLTVNAVYLLYVDPVPEIPEWLLDHLDAAITVGDLSDTNRTLFFPWFATRQDFLDALLPRSWERDDDEKSTALVAIPHHFSKGIEHHVFVERYASLPETTLPIPEPPPKEPMPELVRFDLARLMDGEKRKSPRILILGNGQALENYAKKMSQWLVDRHDITFARTRGTMDWLEWHHIQEHIKQRTVDPPEHLDPMLISFPAYDRTNLDKNQTLKELFMNGRFYRISCMIWASYHNLLPRWARSQVWFTVIDPAYYVERPELCRDVWKIFFSWIPDESDFLAVLADHAKAGHVLISDRSHCRKGIAEHVCWDE